MTQKQTVYLPKDDSKTVFRPINLPVEGTIRKEGYFFTPEQLNEYTANVIKEALQTAAEKMYETFHTICEDGSTKGVFKTQKEALDFADILNNKTNLYHDWVKVTRLNGGFDKQSITNTFEETFKKFEV